MPKFLVWDNKDADILAILRGLSNNWRDATDEKGAARLYANDWYKADDDGQDERYCVYVLSEPEARRIFADTAEDFTLEEWRKAAKCFGAYLALEVEEIEQEDEDEEN